MPRGGLQRAFIMPPAALGTFYLGQSLAPSCSFKGGASLPSPPGPQPGFTPSFSLSCPWPHSQTRLQVSGRALAFLSELGQARATDQRNPREFQIVPGSAGLDLPHKV